MKVLIYSQVFYPEEFRINDIVASLVQNGHEVTVVTGLPFSNYPARTIPSEYRFFRKRKENYQGATILRVPMTARKTGAIRLMLNYFTYMFFASIYSLFLSNKYDVVFSYEVSPVIQVIPAIIYKKWRKKKLITYCLDLWPESIVATDYVKSKGTFYKMVEKLSSWIYRSSDRVLISSPFFKDELIHLGVTEEKIIYWPQFADDLFKQATESLEETEINPDDFNIVFAGNIGKVQNLEAILHMFKSIEDEKIHLYLLGDGSEKEHLEKIVLTEEIPRVHFLGRKPLSTMPSYYNHASLLLASLVDGSAISKTLPAKVQSYMIFGKPILGIGGLDIQRVIEESQGGIYVNTHDAVDLKQKLNQLINHPDLLNEYGNNGNKYCEEHFDKDILIKQLIESMKEACEVE